MKFDLLGVPPGPVNTADCAVRMAHGAVAALAARIGVAVTGVGGPGPDEGVPAGTVHLACADWTGEGVHHEIHVAFPPSEAVDTAVAAALELLAQSLMTNADGATGLAAWRDSHRRPVSPHR